MNLRELYDVHQGKVSDKWRSYFGMYDTIFAPFRSRPVSLLEIGIQNGGSLELWAKYFPDAEHLVGCDIDPNCASLVYDDPRIEVTVGDANAPATLEHLKSKFGSFDIIIDDGSHTSKDIVRAFVNYFNMIRPGGVFVAEDLHCSYWKDYEGGLFFPVSSINFFKALCDVLNFEFWGVKVPPMEVLREFEGYYGVTTQDLPFAEIERVGFWNSACEVHRRAGPERGIGPRVVRGQVATVNPSVALVDGVRLWPPDESGSLYSRRVRRPR